MEILIVQVFVSLLLVASGVVLLAYSIKSADHEHADRLSLMPLSEDSTPGEDRGATQNHV